MPTFSRRKALGQHFLIDNKVIGEITHQAVTLMEKLNIKHLIEIGPGQGAITRPLVKALPEGSQFTAIERDEKLAGILIDEFPKVHFVVADFLKTEFKNIIGDEPVLIVSNLPYSSGTSIFLELAKYPAQIKGMVLMFQAEVAQRLYAAVGERERGSLSIWTQNHWSVEKLITVSPRAFQPPPRVQSEVVTVYPRTAPLIKGSDENIAVFEKLLKQAFIQPRRMLRANLKGFQQILDNPLIDGTKRPQQLDWNEWQILFDSAQSRGFFQSS